MPIAQTEFETLIADPTKVIRGDLVWSEDEDHSPALQFRAEIGSEGGYPLFVHGRVNPLAGTVSFTLVHRGTGRIYGLDLGADHHNPSCTKRRREAQAPVDQPVRRQGGLRAGRHHGTRRGRPLRVVSILRGSEDHARRHPGARAARSTGARTVTEQLEAVLRENMGALFVVSRKGDLVRIRTPFWYPDGGVVDLFVKAHGSVLTLTDLGEALGWLRMQTLGSRRSPKQQKLVQDVCLTQGVELFKGQLMLRCSDIKELPRAVVNLGQAVVRVSDLWFTTRTRSVESISDEVGDFLQEQQVAHERAVKLSGRSGRDWTVDSQTRTPSQSALVCVLASGSRAAARRISEHVLAAWIDLVMLKAGPTPIRFLSLFDDTSDVWADEDFRLLEPVSDVCRWSQPDELIQRIRPAA
jgi:hypothetical protein